MCLFLELLVQTARCRHVYILFCENNIAMTSTSTYIPPAKTTENKNGSTHKSFATDPNKKKSEFRNYSDSQRQATVEKFYKLQHTNMTHDLVMKKRANYLKFDKCKLSMFSTFIHKQYIYLNKKKQLGNASIFE